MGKNPAMTPAANSNTEGGFSVSADPTWRDNAPNADILLSSLRAAGYSIEAVVGDLIDNSIDAKAENIVVWIDRDSKTKEWTIEIADDGEGMDEDELDQMMRLGSRRERDLRSDLGAFGLGSDTSVLAVGKNKHVITRIQGAKKQSLTLSSMWDLDEIVKQRKFVKLLSTATDDEAAFLDGAFERAKLKKPKSGTIVRVGKCDRMERKRVGPALKALSNYLGSTYRHFLVPEGDRKIYLNGELVQRIDPLRRDDEETKILFDDYIEHKFKGDDGEERVERVGVVVVQLPDHGPEVNKQKGITAPKQGYYVCRNGREIVASSTMGWYGRHGQYNCFRAEINLPATIDEEVGLTFRKSQAEIDMTQSLADRIKEKTETRRIQIGETRSSKRKNPKGKVPGADAAQVIESRSALLKRPKADVPPKPPKSENAGKTDEKPKGGDDSPETPGTSSTPGASRGFEKIHQVLTSEAEFTEEAMGPTAPFFTPLLSEKKLVIVYNSDHPAYERLLLDNEDRPGLAAAINFLTWSWGAAERALVDELNAEWAEGLRETASFNLRRLLGS